MNLILLWILGCGSQDPPPPSLEDTAADSRKAALYALDPEALGEAEAQVHKMATSDPNMVVRQLSLRILAGTKNPKFIPLLRDQLDIAPHPQMQYAAIYGLGIMKHPEACKHLANALVKWDHERHEMFPVIIEGLAEGGNICRKALEKAKTPRTEGRVMDALKAISRANP